MMIFQIPLRNGRVTSMIVFFNDFEDDSITVKYEVKEEETESINI